VCRFYIQKDVPEEYITQLNAIEGVETVMVEGDGNWKFTVERFKVIDEEGVDYVIFRDTDSRLNKRESAAVEEWIKAGTALHVMRDHPRHGSFPILAGMWGLKKEKFDYGMADTLKDYEKREIAEQYHYDQIFLGSYIWPSFTNDCTIHDEFFTSNPFPLKREGDFFVGQSFDESDETPQDAIHEMKCFLMPHE
jgi:hypothetical protein